MSEQQIATENMPSATPSPDGRRVLVAVVTGGLGERIQAWREQHDPEQARRLPPHITLCYWVNGLDPDALEQQVRHAFATPVTVRLAGVREFDNEEHTFYIGVTDTAALDAARRRLYDSTFCALPPLREWTWHVTCIRDARRRDRDELRAAATELEATGVWRIDRVALLELRGKAYEPLRAWQV